MSARPVSPLPALCVSKPRSFERRVGLSEVLDRVLTKGAVVAGEVVVSIAGIDLLYLGLNLVLTSVETARRSKLEAIDAQR